MESKLSISYSKKIFGKMYARLTRQVTLYLKPKNRFKLPIYPIIEFTQFTLLPDLLYIFTQIMEFIISLR